MGIQKGGSKSEFRCGGVSLGVGLKTLVCALGVSSFMCQYLGRKRYEMRPIVFDWYQYRWP